MNRPAMQLQSSQKELTAWFILEFLFGSLLPTSTRLRHSITWHWRANSSCKWPRCLKLGQGGKLCHQPPGTLLIDYEWLWCTVDAIFPNLIATSNPRSNIKHHQSFRFFPQKFSNSAPFEAFVFPPTIHLESACGWARPVDRSADRSQAWADDQESFISFSLLIETNDIDD